MLSVVLLIVLWTHQHEALQPLSRRDSVKAILSLPGVFLIAESSGAAASTKEADDGFHYNDEWTGTKLGIMNLETASSSSKQQWDMGQWPDPILRRPAQPVDSRWYGTLELDRAAQLLTRTAIDNKAVGLAAQQCGVDARMVYVEAPGMMVMVNPLIVGRSPETDMRVWNEFCLVLPPSFRATVLRDDWIDVEYHDTGGKLRSIRLTGEAARAAQHELDHDRGILTLDHVGLDELENDVMRSIEREGHDERQALAFSRAVDEKEVESTILPWSDVLASSVTYPYPN